VPESEKYGFPLKLDEAWLCLDFANVIGWFLQEQSANKLTYLHLLGWAKQAQVIQEKTFEKLQHQAKQSPKKTKQAIQKVLALREITYQILSAHIWKKPPTAKNLSSLNLLLSETLQHAQVASDQEKFVWSWTDSDTHLESPLWPVVRSVAELLTSDDLRRIGQCSSDNCPWLFYDTSKNHSRRWCSMKMCGNVAKARRHYTRHKKST